MLYNVITNHNNHHKPRECIAHFYYQMNQKIMLNNKKDCHIIFKINIYRINKVLTSPNLGDKLKYKL